MNIPSDLVSAWSHLASAQESLDGAAHTVSPIEERVMALHAALAAVLAVEHVVLRHVADRRNRLA